MSDCHGEMKTCSNKGCTRTTFSDLCAYCNAAMQIPTIALFGLIELQLKLAGLTLEQYLKMAGIVTDQAEPSKPTEAKRKQWKKQINQGVEHKG